MDRWQQIGYFSYKAKLRQDINDDWIDINHDIWVSLFFICPTVFLFLPRVISKTRFEAPRAFRVPATFLH